MSNRSQIFNFATDAGTAIDAEKGVILGVAVITEGPALGHFDFTGEKPLPLYADAGTLDEVKTCAESYTGGLKVKFNHGSGVADIVGVLKNFRIEASVLRADFHALKNAANRDYLFEIAGTMPESFGLSISFSGLPKRDEDRAYARCSEIYSADFVDEPAANPNGLFQRGAGNGTAQEQPKSNLKMEEDKKDPIADLSASVAALLSRLEALEAMMPKEEEKLEEKEEEVTDEAMNALAEKAALAALKTYTKEFGAPPAKPSHEAKREEKTEKKFEAIVAEKAKELNSKAKAIAWAVANHAAEHKAYLGRLSSGEVINL
jgi:hypothetical protein